MSVFLDVFFEAQNPGYKVYGVKRGGDIDVISNRHLPWFYLMVKNLDEKTLESIKRVPEVVNIVVFDPHERTPLIPYGVRYMPSLDYNVLKVEATKKEYVPQLAATLTKSIPGSYAGEYNIVYPVRVSFDLDVKYFHPKCPVIFQMNSELEQTALEVIEGSRDLRIMAFDIEVFTEHGRFPKPGNPLLSIQYGVMRLDDPDFFTEKWVKDNVVVIESKNLKDSQEMVDQFFKDINRIRPDIVVGYNSTEFDIKYLAPFLKIPKLTIPDKRHFFVNNKAYPHVDLMVAREIMGSSLGVRSQRALALDDVVAEVASEVKELAWLFKSKYMEAEERLDHTKIAMEWSNRSELFYNYVMADVYLTLILARLWMPTIVLLSSLVQVPITELARLNTGQIAEYNIVHWLERLGFATVILERDKEFKKVLNLGSFSKFLPEEYSNLFRKGKVYVRDYGVVKHVLEGDFAQLYPTLMSNEALDPLGFRSWYVVSSDNPFGATYYSDPLFEGMQEDKPKFKITQRLFPTLLGVNPRGKKGGEKKASEHMVPRELHYTVSTYGPVAFLLLKMFLMRRITKKLKKRADKEGRPEFKAPDQAVKILNNASYGAFSKERGFINQVMSGYVFWKTLLILYDVINYAEKELKLQILYGDTDSLFIRCDVEEARKLFPDKKADREKCREWFEKVVLPKLNGYVKSKYGKEFEMDSKSSYDICIYPKLKKGAGASKKSYICGHFDGEGKLKVEVFKGDFYKVLAPEAIRERLAEFYEMLIRGKPETAEGVEKLMKSFLKDVPTHKLFVKKSVDDFTSEEQGKKEDKKYVMKLKNLNKPFHYAALHLAYAWHLPGVEVIKKVARSNGIEVEYFVDAEQVLSTGSIQVYFLPGNTPKDFTVFIDERDGKVVLHKVKVLDIDVKSQREEGNVYKDVGYVVKEIYVEKELTREKVLDASVKSMRKYIIDDIARKLLPALQRYFGGALDKFIKSGGGE